MVQYKQIYFNSMHNKCAHRAKLEDYSTSAVDILWAIIKVKANDDRFCTGVD